MGEGAWKTIFFLVGWSALLVVLLESRVQGLQEAHQRDLRSMEEAHRRDLEEIRAAMRSYHHHLASLAGSPGGSSPPSFPAAPNFPEAELAEQQRRQLEVAGPLPALGASPAAADPPPALPEAEDGGTRPSLRSASGTRPRKLSGFYPVGTSKTGVICAQFAGASSHYDMSSNNCRGTNQICAGCFIATDDGADKTLDIIKCSTAKYKLNTGMIGTGHVLEIIVMNGDPDNTLTVRGCGDATCSVPSSTYTMNGGGSVMGFCYAGGNNQLYFPTTVFQNEDSYTFAGRTIHDLGSVATADLNGGTIDDMDITVGSGKTLDLSGATITLDSGAIAASKIAPGVFGGTGTYSFTGSTIDGTGVVTNADIDSGSIDGVTIRTSDITVGAGNTFDVSAGTLTLAASQVKAASITGGATDGKFTKSAYSFAGSTIADLGEVMNADIKNGTIDSATVGATTAAAGKFTTLEASGEFKITSSEISADTPTSTTQSGVLVSTTENLAAGADDLLNITNDLVKADSVILATANGCHGGDVQVVSAYREAGSFLVKTTNRGASACTSSYMVSYLILNGQSDSEVTCDAGYFRSGTSCEACNGATRRRRALSCTACPTNYYDNGNGDDCAKTMSVSGFATESNRDCAGGDMPLGVSTTGVTTCGGRCAARWDCGGFSYHYGTTNCRLKWLGHCNMQDSSDWTFFRKR